MVPCRPWSSAVDGGLPHPSCILPILPLALLFAPECYLPIALNRCPWYWDPPDNMATKWASAPLWAIVVLRFLQWWWLINDKGLSIKLKLARATQGQKLLEGAIKQISQSKFTPPSTLSSPNDSICKLYFQKNPNSQVNFFSFVRVFYRDSKYHYCSVKCSLAKFQEWKIMKL